MCVTASIEMSDAISLYFLYASNACVMAPPHCASPPDELPDSAAAGVQVVSGHRANDGSWRCVLIYVQEVGGLSEDGRLVHIQDIDLDRRRVLEGPQVQEPSVCQCIGHLHFKGVGLFGLIVKHLQETGTKTEVGNESGGYCSEAFLSRSILDIELDLARPRALVFQQSPVVIFIYLI